MTKQEEKKLLIKLLLMDSHSTRRLAQYLGTTEEHIKELLEEIKEDIKLYTDGNFVWIEEQEG